MTPPVDALYHIHEYQATCRGLNPLPYIDFCEHLRHQTETDLTQLLLPASKANAPVKSDPKFALGKLCITQAAADAVPPNEIIRALVRHASGDWGLLEPGDCGENERALARGGRLVSVYCARNGSRFYVITDAGGEVTTVLLPRDY